MFQDCDRSSAFLIFYVISEAVDTVHELVKSYKHIFLLILFPSFSRFDWFFKIVLGPAFLKRFLGLIVWSPKDPLSFLLFIFIISFFLGDSSGSSEIRVGWDGEEARIFFDFVLSLTDILQGCCRDSFVILGRFTAISQDLLRLGGKDAAALQQLETRSLLWLLISKLMWQPLDSTFWYRNIYETKSSWNEVAITQEVRNCLHGEMHSWTADPFL